ncbi:hypothetical protein [Pseudomonas soli]|uniref:hypothetical protein n=1 Tax=Pseudomonas soli TaxID=1306993 RepID=UPI00345CE6AC
MKKETAATLLRVARALIKSPAVWRLVAFCLALYGLTMPDWLAEAIGPVLEILLEEVVTALVEGPM